MAHSAASRRSEKWHRAASEQAWLTAYRVRALVQERLKAMPIAVGIRYNAELVQYDLIFSIQGFEFPCTQAEAHPDVLFTQILLVTQ